MVSSSLLSQIYSRKDFEFTRKKFFFYKYVIFFLFMGVFKEILSLYAMNIFSISRQAV